MVKRSIVVGIPNNNTDGNIIGITSTGKLFVSAYGVGTINDDVILPSGKPCFLGVSIKNNGLTTFYGDSPTPTNVIATINLRSTSKASYIGKSASTTYPAFLNGSLDELLIIPRALSQAEIAQYYNALMTTMCKTLMLKQA